MMARNLFWLPCLVIGLACTVALALPNSSEQISVGGSPSPRSLHSLLSRSGTSSRVHFQGRKLNLLGSDETFMELLTELEGQVKEIVEDLEKERKEIDGQYNALVQSFWKKSLIDIQDLEKERNEIDGQYNEKISEAKKLLEDISDMKLEVLSQSKMDSEAEMDYLAEKLHGVIWPAKALVQSYWKKRLNAQSAAIPTKLVSAAIPTKLMSEPMEQLGKLDALTNLLQDKLAEAEAKAKATETVKSRSCLASSKRLIQEVKVAITDKQEELAQLKTSLTNENDFQLVQPTNSESEDKMMALVEAKGEVVKMIEYSQQLLSDLTGTKDKACVTVEGLMAINKWRNALANLNFKFWRLMHPLPKKSQNSN